MIKLKNKYLGSVFINSDQYQVGSFVCILYSEEKVKIIPGYGGKTYEGHYSSFENPNTGLPFGDLTSIKAFITNNFFFDPSTSNNEAMIFEKVTHFSDINMSDTRERFIRVAVDETNDNSDTLYRMDSTGQIQWIPNVEI